MKVLHTIRDTPPNPSGLVTLSISTENCFLAYPGSNTIGEVQIFDANNLVSLRVETKYLFIGIKIHHPYLSHFICFPYHKKVVKSGVFYLIARLILYLKKKVWFRILQTGTKQGHHITTFPGNKFSKTVKEINLLLALY